MLIRIAASLALAIAPAVANAQSAPLNPYNIRTGTTQGTVAAGDDSRIAGAVQSDSDGKVLSASLVNRPAISPVTTTVGTSATVIFTARSAPSTFVSVVIKLAGYGVQVACTGDGTAPVIGVSATISGPNQAIYWPMPSGGAVPPGPVQCIGTSVATIIAEAA